MKVPSDQKLPEIVPIGDKPPYTAELLRSLGLTGLHCGSGRNLIHGFVNTDIMIFRGVDDVQTEEGMISMINGKHYYMSHDSTKNYPFQEGSFDHVYSEHFIEHITPVEALKWMKEVRRLLKPGGTARISTPDLELFTAGYFDPKGNFNAGFIDRLNRMGMRISTPRKAFVMNLIFRQWGHQWLYDFQEIKTVALQAGFMEGMVTRCGYREGKSAPLRSLDLEVRNDHSLYVEITRE
jgi:predicted SAM-dependent methyltransferase